MRRIKIKFVKRIKNIKIELVRRIKNIKSKMNRKKNIRKTLNINIRVIVEVDIQK